MAKSRSGARLARPLGILGYIISEAASEKRPADHTHLGEHIP